MNSYGLPFFPLNELAEIAPRREAHYKLDGIDFLLKPGTDVRRLLVTFHGISRGSDQKTVIPIFRGYNWSFPQTAILSFSDRLLEIYRQNIILAWFLGTSANDYRSMYAQITRSLAEMLGVNEVICFGSSGGGHPAMWLAKELGQRAIVSNSQIYLGRYGNHLENLERTVAKEGERLLHVDANEIVRSSTQSSRLQIFQNSADTHHHQEHFLPFKQACSHLPVSDQLEWIEFDAPAPPGSDPHGNLFPSGTWLLDYL